jgi:type I restriction enzyme, S subunit
VISNQQPEIRFPGFFGYWEQCDLEDVANFSKGNGYSKSDLTDEGNPIILYGRLYTKYETVIKTVDTFTKTKEKSVISKGNEVIVPSSGETSEDISRASFVSVPGVILGGDLNIIRPGDGIDPIFLALTISNGEQQKELSKRAQGKSVVHLHNSDLKKVNLVFPKREEQTKIGNFFKKVDDLIVLHQQELATLKQTKQGFLQKLFPKEGKSVPEFRFPGFSGDWKLKKLGDVLESLYNGQTPSRNKKEFWNGDINWLTSGELNRSTVNSATEKITELGQKDANLKVVPKNTFVIAITGLEAAGTRGNCGILGIDTTLNQSCMALFPKKSLLDTHFLFQWYRMVGENYGLRFTQGTKQQSYNAEIIKKLDICLPKIEEQIKIGKFFKHFDETIELQEKELEALKETKKAFLQKMFV